LTGIIHSVFVSGGYFLLSVELATPTRQLCGSINMPIDLIRLFGYQGVLLTPGEFFLWIGIMICIAVVVILDVPFLFYKKIRKN
jgi:hypothetical protein